MEKGIYDDLEGTDLGENIEQLERTNQVLSSHIKKLDNDIARLCDEIKNMKQVQENLTKNISELFKTAKAEIARKDRMIADLRSELDNVLFRRRGRDLSQKTDSYKRQRSEAYEVTHHEHKKSRTDVTAESLVDSSNTSDSSNGKFKSSSNASVHKLIVRDNRDQYKRSNSRSRRRSRSRNRERSRSRNRDAANRDRRDRHSRNTISQSESRDSRQRHASYERKRNDRLIERRETIVDVICIDQDTKEDQPNRIKQSAMGDLISDEQLVDTKMEKCSTTINKSFLTRQDQEPVDCNDVTSGLNNLNKINCDNYDNVTYKYNINPTNNVAELDINVHVKSELLEIDKPGNYVKPTDLNDSGATSSISASYILKNSELKQEHKNEFINKIETPCSTPVQAVCFRNSLKSETLGSNTKHDGVNSDNVLVKNDEVNTTINGSSHESPSDADATHSTDNSLTNSLTNKKSVRRRRCVIQIVD